MYPAWRQAANNRTAIRFSPGVPSQSMSLGALVVPSTLLTSQKVSAQSTLFNIPSTDTVAARKTYVEFDFISHLQAHDKGGFQAYVPRVVFGVAGSRHTDCWR